MKQEKERDSMCEIKRGTKTEEKRKRKKRGTERERVGMEEKYEIVFGYITYISSHVRWTRHHI